MAGQRPRMGYNMYSTPFSRNDATFNGMGWVPLGQPQPAQQPPPPLATSPDGTGEGQIPSARGFHNHFTVSSPRATTPQTHDTVRFEYPQGTSSWTMGSPQSTRYTSSFLATSQQTSSPAEFGQMPAPNPIQNQQSFTDRNSASNPFESHIPGVPLSFLSQHVVLPTASCPIVPTRYSWSPLTPQEEREYARPITSPTTSYDHQRLTPQTNPSLVSYTIDPLQRALEWNRHGSPLESLNFNDSAKLYRSFTPDHEVGDRKRNKLPVSPLDSTYPPVARYLMPYFPGPLDSSLRQKFEPRFRVLRACCQIEPIPIEIFCGGLHGISKLNEGVFGEVYIGNFNGNRVDSVYKVVPIEGSVTVNGEVQKRFEQIETEVRVSQRLNTLNKGRESRCSGFCQLYRSRVMKGAYPQVLVRAWKKWHRDHQSDNDEPTFGEQQLYVVFEYEHCGSDMESFTFRNAEQAYLALLQVAFSLAVAESELDFEHRDLHWGNILVKSTDNTKIDFRVEGVAYAVPSGGLKTSIIDFTMSRCNDEVGHAIFDDLKDDETQFMGSASEYQFEIYRKMRAINNNNWSDFHPRTNTFWLHYLADKLLKKAFYTSKISRRHKVYRTMLENFMDQILTYASCTDFVKTLKHYVVTPTSGRGGSGRRN